MNAPLSLFLTRFSAPAPDAVVAIETAFEPLLSMSAADLDARLQAAADAARDEAARAHEEAHAVLIVEHEAALARSLAEARAGWVEAEGTKLAEGLATAVTDLRTLLASKAADVLRPIVADAVLARTMSELSETLDRLLADPRRPLLRVRGPADLIAPIRAATQAEGIEWVEAETAEVSIIADATHVTTRLAAATAALKATEA